MRKISAAIAAMLITPMLVFNVPAAHAEEVPGDYRSCRSFNGHIKANILVSGTRATLNLNSTMRRPKVKVTTTAYTRKGQKLWVVDSRTLRGSGLREFHFQHEVRRGWITSTRVSLTNGFGRCTVKERA